MLSHTLSSTQSPQRRAAQRGLSCSLPIVATLLFTGLFPTVAAADVAQTAAQRCAIQTHAPGNYNISNAPGVPHVIPGQGGTTAGAARMNDCLLDAYGVQFGAGRGEAVATVQTTATARTGRLNCERILNRSPGVAATYAVGATLVFGAVGAGTQAGVYQRNLNTCLAANRTVAPRDTTAAIVTGCRRANGVIRGGSSLCVSP